MYDIALPVQGKYMPANWQYPFYAALCSQLDRHILSQLGFRLTGGTQRHTPKLLRVMDTARMVFRCDEDQLQTVFRFAGRRFEIQGHAIRLGAPTCYRVEPAKELYSRMVTFANILDPISFQRSLQKALDKLEVTATAIIPCHPDGNPIKRYISIKDTSILGYRVVLQGLSDDDSLKVLRHGIGGRRRMGCGIFAPCH